MKANPDPPPCWGGLLICIYPVAIIFSILVQCFITAWRIDHKNRQRSRRRHVQHRSNSRPRETREEARQRKYRYLYQVRTARGDIISQVSATHFYDNYLFLKTHFIVNSLKQHFSTVLFLFTTELCICITKTSSTRLSTTI